MQYACSPTARSLGLDTPRVFTFCIASCLGPKKSKIFWPKLNILKGNHGILLIQLVTVRQKLNMILENDGFTN